MEQVTWCFAVPLYPIHFQNTVGAVMQHVASYVNRFVPDLNALLVKFEKETLRLLTSDENPGVSHCTLVPIRPELPTLYIRAQLAVSVFSPRVGMQMTATVSALMSRLIICKTDIPNVSLSVPLCPENDVSNASLSSEKKIMDTTVRVNDVIRVRLSAVSLHPNVVLLRGNLIGVLSSDADPVPMLASKDLHNSGDGGDSLFAKARKRGKAISPDVLKSNEEMITIKSEPEPEQWIQKKRPFTENEQPVDMSSADSSDVIEPPKKKKRKSELELSSSVVGSLIKLALPASSDGVHVSAEDYKVIVETPVSHTSSKSSPTTTMSQAIVDLITCLIPQAHSPTSNPSAELALCVQSYTERAGQIGDLSGELSDKEVHEAFCLCCIDYLERVSRISSELATSGDLLFSVAREQQLRKCLEFLICLGVYPMLDNGVGLPLSMRLDSVAYNCPNQSGCPDRCTKLLKVARCLIFLRESKLVQLNRLMSPGVFLGDLITCLVQIAHGPVGLAPTVDGQLLSEQRKASAEARKQLWKLLCDLPRHVAMKELLILQGGATGVVKVKGSVQLPSAPRWLQKICGGLLSRLLVRPYGFTQAHARSGVKDLLLATASLAPGVISSTSSAGCINSLDPRLQPAVAQALASIFTTTPSFLIKPAEQSVGVVQLDYNSAIAAQILELFDLKEQRQFNTSTDQNKMSDSLIQFAYLVALTTAHEFCTRYPDLGKQLYLSPLIGMLRRLVIRPDDVSTPTVAETSTVPDLTDECELVTAAELRKILDVLRDLLAVPTPSQTVLLEALELSQPLFCLLVQIKADSDDVDTNPEFSFQSSQSTNQTSSLKSLLLGILSRLLSCVTESRSGHLNIIRQWLELPPTTLSFVTQSNSTTDTLENRPLTICPVHPRLKFRPPQLVRVMHDEQNLDRSDYRAVLTREGVSITDQPEMLTSLVSVIIDMLQFVNPRQAKPNESNGRSVPHSQIITACATDGDVAKRELPTISADLFISLIADLNDNLRPLIQRPSPEVGILPFNEVGDISVEKSAKTGILSSLLAAAMLDCLGDQIWPDEPEQVVNLLEMTLSRLYMLMSRRIEAEMEELLLETLSQILGILAFYTQRLKPGETNITDQFGRLLPILSDMETEIRANSVVASRAQLELLHCLRVMLATRGAVDLTNSKVDSVQPDPTALKSPSPDRIISEANHNVIEEILPSDSQTSSAVNGEEPLDPELEEAFEQLKDPLVPVRGHALISLSRLLESRHKCTIGKEERIFQVLFHHLSDEDSYVYLNAIRGLAALGHSLTDRTLTALLDRFRQLCIPVSGKEPSQQASHNSRVEFILKLGEAIMRILRDLGYMAPKYRTQVLHCMTVGSRDTEPLVRAASLSNVTELCRLLRHAMGPIVYEIFYLIELHLTQDHSPSVRQAAANLARAFFLEEQLPDWLAPDVIRDLNRLLSNRSKIERDPCVLEQIEAALGQLDKCTRSSVFLKPLTPESLLKEIRISRPF